MNSLVVLTSLHASICLAIAALVYLPLEGVAGAAVLGGFAIATFTVALRVSRHWHRRRAAALAAQAAPGDD